MTNGERVSNKDNFICQFVLTKGRQVRKSAGAYIPLVAKNNE